MRNYEQCARGASMSLPCDFSTREHVCNVQPLERVVFKMKQFSWDHLLLVLLFVSLGALAQTSPVSFEGHASLCGILPLLLCQAAQFQF